ncbi:peptide-methionine (S)-S-oxide reductase MsrA [Nitrogeniibacter aestuarii]|uniref:peptide-methionine (S)-S-oxide reductase MsrA n=1 Tax=Nitrogeniibacter aestuarii TaxID=2815343 RepID=UPI001E4A2958|nr:peptide-methionine (S)-S-oxide reductase MsrA [Nitrogeniibacter aestuarii]
MSYLSAPGRVVALVAILIGSAAAPARAAEALATFAGGCFWSLEAAFDKLPGVLETTTGYTGGQDDAPTYERVTSGSTGHREAVRVRYDPEKLTYETLLVTFWHSINPVDRQGQFCDVGPSYTTAIFTHSAEQKRLAEESRTFLEQLKFRRPLATDILDAKRFYPAEPEHQDFARQHPQTYARYRRQCGTDLGLAAIWGR